MRKKGYLMKKLVLTKNEKDFIKMNYKKFKTTKEFYDLFHTNFPKRDINNKQLNSYIRTVYGQVKEFLNLTKSEEKIYIKNNFKKVDNEIEYFLKHFTQENMSHNDLIDYIKVLFNKEISKSTLTRHLKKLKVKLSKSTSWSDEEIKWIKMHKGKCTSLNTVITLFNKTFNNNKSNSSISTKIYRMYKSRTNYLKASV